MNTHYIKKKDDTIRGPKAHVIKSLFFSLSGNKTTAMNDWKGAWWYSSFTNHSGILCVSK